MSASVRISSSISKDPGRTPSTSAADSAVGATPSSPTRTLTPGQLARYLDYCSEMLSLLSKLAALCAQRFNDPVTLAAVNELEALTNGLSRKVWQKIMILDRVDVSEPEAPPAVPGPAARVADAAGPGATGEPVASVAQPAAPAVVAQAPATVQATTVQTPLTRAPAPASNGAPRP